MATALLQGSGAGGTSKAYGSNVVAGSILICVAYVFSSGQTQTSCSDTRSNSWSPLGVGSDATAGVSIGIWSAVSNGAGADTVTPVMSATVSEIIVLEFSGPTGATLDGTVQATHITSTTPWVTPTDTTTAANDLLLHCVSAATLAPTFNSPWALGASVSGDTTNQVGWRGDVAAGTIAPNASFSGTDSGASVVVALSTPLPAVPGGLGSRSGPRRSGPGHSPRSFAKAFESAIVQVQVTGTSSPLIVSSIPPPPVPAVILGQGSGTIITTPTNSTTRVATPPALGAAGQRVIARGADAVVVAPSTTTASLVVGTPTVASPGRPVVAHGTDNAVQVGTLIQPTQVITPPGVQPVARTVVTRGGETVVVASTTSAAPVVVAAFPVTGTTALTLLQGAGTIVPTVTVPSVLIVTAPFAPVRPQTLTQQAGVTSAQVEATGLTGIIFGSTAIPTVSASGSTAIIFNATGVPTESAIGTSSIIFNSTGAGTTPGGVSTFVSMRGANSAFVNVASATTDAPFTGGIIPAIKAGQCVNVLAVTFNADTAADTLVFNSKGAGVGTAISALFSNPINGSVVWPYTPVGWFTTNGGEGLSVTTTGASPTHVQIIFEYINA